MKHSPEMHNAIAHELATWNVWKRHTETCGLCGFNRNRVLKPHEQCLEGRAAYEENQIAQQRLDEQTACGGFGVCNTCG